MVHSDQFNIVAEPAEGVYKDKGSSFISFVFPILEESSVKDILIQLKKAHPKARHICYAYRWGQDPDYHRLHDDGEPSGTAAKPILNQLKSYNLENTFIAVVRYFGGTLLGVPGLIQAYKFAASDSIYQAKVISIRRNVYFDFRCSYHMEKHMIQFGKKHNGEIRKRTYSESVELEIAFPLSMIEKIIPMLQQTAIEMQWQEEVSCVYRSHDLF